MSKRSHRGRYHVPQQQSDHRLPDSKGPGFQKSPCSCKPGREFSHQAEDYNTHGLHRDHSGGEPAGEL